MRSRSRTAPRRSNAAFAADTDGAFHRTDDGYAGQSVHMPARIDALAAAGEILVSRESVGGASPFALSTPRTEKLKGFDGPVELVSVAWR